MVKIMHHIEFQKESLNFTLEGLLSPNCLTQVFLPLEVLDCESEQDDTESEQEYQKKSCVRSVIALHRKEEVRSESVDSTNPHSSVARPLSVVLEYSKSDVQSSESHDGNEAI